MVAVTVNEHKAAGAGNPVITWGDGRTMTLKEPGVLASFDLIAMLGARLAENTTYVSMVFPLIYLDKLDNEPEHFASLAELRNTINHLGNDGMKALRDGVRQHFGQASAEEEKAAIKNE